MALCPELVVLVGSQEAVAKVIGVQAEERRVMIAPTSSGQRAIVTLLWLQWLRYNT